MPLFNEGPSSLTAPPAVQTQREPPFFIDLTGSDDEQAPAARTPLRDAQPLFRPKDAAAPTRFATRVASIDRNPLIPSTSNTKSLVTEPPHQPLFIRDVNGIENGREDQAGGVANHRFGDVLENLNRDFRYFLNENQDGHDDDGDTTQDNEDEIERKQEEVKDRVDEYPDSPLGRHVLPAQASVATDATTSSSRERLSTPTIASATACLDRILPLFPDVSHEHIRFLWTELSIQDEFPALAGFVRFEMIVEKLMANPAYPRQPKGKSAQLQRKRSPSVSAEEINKARKRFAASNRRSCAPEEEATALEILRTDFEEYSWSWLTEQIRAHGHLFQAYLAVAATDFVSYPAIESLELPPAWVRIALLPSCNSRSKARLGHLPELYDELQVARQQVKELYMEQAMVEHKRATELDNVRTATASGFMAECQACFEELPMNRQIHCSGVEPHYTCYDCALTYLRCQVGEARSQLVCTAGCGADFPPAQLNLLSDKGLLEKFGRLVREDDIREAALKDLEECPFCDFKAILAAPVEEDFEFRCLNPECEKVSCRRCRLISHVPLSCEEFVKDKKLHGRHRVEEAMTAAMVRLCNRCKKQFIKEHGCNKMSCPCGHRQCYICSASLTSDYDHFDRNDVTLFDDGVSSNDKAAKKRRCPLFDNVEARHEREVREAAVEARKAVLEDNPDVTEQDLDIQFSDAVQTTATRPRGQAAAEGVQGAPRRARRRYPRHDAVAAPYVHDYEPPQLDDEGPPFMRLDLDPYQFPYVNAPVPPIDQINERRRDNMFEQNQWILPQHAQPMQMQEQFVLERQKQWQQQRNLDAVARLHAYRPPQQLFAPPALALNAPIDNELDGFEDMNRDFLRRETIRRQQFSMQQAAQHMQRVPQRDPRVTGSGLERNPAQAQLPNQSSIRNESRTPLQPLQDDATSGHANSTTQRDRSQQCNRDKAEKPPLEAKQDPAEPPKNHLVAGPSGPTRAANPVIETPQMPSHGRAQQKAESVRDPIEKSNFSNYGHYADNNYFYSPTTPIVPAYFPANPFAALPQHEMNEAFLFGGPYTLDQTQHFGLGALDARPETPASPLGLLPKPLKITRQPHVTPLTTGKQPARNQTQSANANSEAISPDTPNLPKSLRIGYPAKSKSTQQPTSPTQASSSSEPQQSILAPSIPPQAGNVPANAEYISLEAAMSAIMPRRNANNPPRPPPRQLDAQPWFYDPPYDYSHYAERPDY